MDSVGHWREPAFISGSMNFSARTETFIQFVIETFVVGEFRNYLLRPASSFRTNFYFIKFKH